MSFDAYMAFFLVAAVLIHFVIAFTKGIETADGSVVRYNHRPFRFWSRLLVVAVATMLFVAAFAADDPKMGSKFVIGGSLLLLLQSGLPGLLSFHRRRSARRQLGEPVATHWVILTATTFLMLAALFLGAWGLAYGPSRSGM